MGWCVVLDFWQTHWTSRKRSKNIWKYCWCRKRWLKAVVVGKSFQKCLASGVDFRINHNNVIFIYIPQNWHQQGQQEHDDNASRNKRNRSTSERRHLHLGCRKLNHHAGRSPDFPSINVKWLPMLERLCMPRSVLLLQKIRSPGLIRRFRSDGDRSLQLLIFSEEFLVSASHQLVLTTSLPFVHAARRSYRLSDPVNNSDWCSAQLLYVLRCRFALLSWGKYDCNSTGKKVMAAIEKIEVSSGASVFYYCCMGRILYIQSWAKACNVEIYLKNMCRLLTGCIWFQVFNYQLLLYPLETCLKTVPQKSPGKFWMLPFSCNFVPNLPWWCTAITKWFTWEVE